MKYKIVMLFLRAKVIPVNPQIHVNVMCPLFVLFVYAPDIIVFLKFHLGTGKIYPRLFFLHLRGLPVI
jgi:hypothetical protein